MIVPRNKGILGSLEPNVNRVWLEVRTLSIHSVCDELLKPLTPSPLSTWVNEHKSFYYGITRITSWAILIDWTRYTKLTCNYSRREKIPRETWICEYWLWFFYPLFSHTLPKPKDPWQRFLAPIQMFWATHWSIQTRSFPPQHFYRYSFYVHFYNSNHLQASWVFNIDPWLVLTLTRSWSWPSSSYWRNGKKIQQLYPGSSSSFSPHKFIFFICLSPCQKLPAALLLCFLPKLPP